MDLISSAVSYFRSIKRISMHGELYQYLVLYKQLNIPGIGTFLLDRTPAEADFPNRLINPPTYSVSLHHGNSHASKNLFRWLSTVLDISERDAVIRFNDFAYHLKNKLQSGDIFQWNGLGTLSKGLAGEIRFDSAMKDLATDPPITAVKVLRENAAHSVRVGEDERTSTEMIELLNPEERHKSYFWAIAIVLLLVSFLFIGYYFSKHGLRSSSAANQQRVESMKTSPH